MKLVRSERQVDGTTGAVLRDTSTVIELRPLPKEPPYIKLYVEDLSRLLGLGNSSILLHIAASIGYDGIVSLSTTRRARIALTCGVSEKTVRNAITEYLHAGVMRRVGRAEYEMDPALFAKGDWSEIRGRRSSFRLEIDYSHETGRTIKARRLAPDEENRAEVERALGQQRLVE